MLRATKICPVHKTSLTGGPIQFLCDQGPHTVHAADIPHEFPYDHLALRHFDQEDLAA
jgi:hypothetical protein